MFPGDMILQLTKRIELGPKTNSNWESLKLSVKREQLTRPHTQDKRVTEHRRRRPEPLRSRICIRIFSQLDRSRWIFDGQWLDNVGVDEENTPEESQGYLKYILTDINLTHLSQFSTADWTVFHLAKDSDSHRTNETDGMITRPNAEKLSLLAADNTGESRCRNGSWWSCHFALEVNGKWRGKQSAGSCW